MKKLWGENELFSTEGVGRWWGGGPFHRKFHENNIFFLNPSLSAKKVMSMVIMVNHQKTLNSDLEVKL